MKKRSRAQILTAILLCFFLIAETAAPAFALTANTKTLGGTAFANTTYTVQEFDDERINFAISYKNIDDCEIEDESIASAEFNYYNSYVTIEGKKRGETILVVTKTNGTVEYYKIVVSAAPMEFTDAPYNDEIDRGDSDYIAVTEGFSDYTWSVDNEKIIKLEDYYSYKYKKKIVAVGKGTVTVTVKNEYGEKVSKKITATAEDFVVDSSANPYISVSVGDYDSLYLPYGYSWEDCTVDVKNKSIARVEKDSTCYVYGTTPGDTKMTVTNQYGESVVCDIHVYKELTKLNFNKDTYTVWMGQTLKLNPNVAPANSNNKLTYDVGYYDDVVSISDNGVVTPISPGTAYGVEVTSECYMRDECDIIVKAPYFGKKNYSIYKNKTLQLKLNGGRTDTTWSSSNSAIATVNSNGKVTAKKAGTVKITANTGGYKVKTTIKVLNPTISKKKATVWAGKTLKLNVTGAAGKVKWKSSNKKVATVNSNGKVTAKKAGTATITAVASGVTLKCKVTVKGPQLSKSKKTLIAKQTFKLKVNGATSKVKWSSSNSTVASVNSAGKVTAKKAGTAYIKAKTGGKTLSCKITVKKNQITYSVDTDPYSYNYGSPTVCLKKAYFDGNSLKVDVWVMNNRMFRADYFDWLTYKLYDTNGNLIASKKFRNVSLYIPPYSSKKITLTFTGSSIKKKNAILNNGVYDDWEFYYYYTY